MEELIKKGYKLSNINKSLSNLFNYKKIDKKLNVRNNLETTLFLHKLEIIRLIKLLKTQNIYINQLEFEINSCKNNKILKNTLSKAINTDKHIILKPDINTINNINNFTSNNLIKKNTLNISKPVDLKSSNINIYKNIFKNNQVNLKQSSSTNYKIYNEILANTVTTANIKNKNNDNLNKEISQTYNYIFNQPTQNKTNINLHSKTNSQFLKNKLQKKSRNLNKTKFSYKNCEIQKYRSSSPIQDNSLWFYNKRDFTNKIIKLN